MNAEQFFNNGFGADVEKVHRKHVIDLMTNFAKHYHTEQCDIANVVGQSEQFFAFTDWYFEKDKEIAEALRPEFEYWLKNKGK